MDTERRSEISCVNCSYDLRGLTAGHRCPECGLSVAQSFQGGSGISGFAIASLVLGIVSFLLVWGGIITAPLALHFARRAKQDMIAGRASPGSRGLATAGVVLAWAWMGIAFLMLGFLTLVTVFG